VVLRDLIGVQVEVYDFGGRREHLAQFGKDLGRDIRADDEMPSPTAKMALLDSPNMWPVCPR